MRKFKYFNTQTRNKKKPGNPGVDGWTKEEWWRLRGLRQRERHLTEREEAEKEAFRFGDFNGFTQMEKNIVFSTLQSQS